MAWLPKKKGYQIASVYEILEQCLSWGGQDVLNGSNHFWTLQVQLVWYLMIFAWTCWSTNSVNIHLPNPFRPKSSNGVHCHRGLHCVSACEAFGWSSIQSILDWFGHTKGSWFLDFENSGFDWPLECSLGIFTLLSGFSAVEQSAIQTALNSTA